ncbi:MAG: glycosyltransferase family 4 protein [Actinobacteria bacterium]|nr:MAG: glycosyltransferase family 4 protein [Actinomycetota bacterium]
MNLLLVAYFYPPCRDTGAHRPTAMAKWLRRLGHRVTVLTTSAYGAGDGAAEEGVVRTPDLQRLRTRLHGHDRVDALFDSDTSSGRPHILSRVIVPEPLVAAWAPFARSRALRLNRRERFDCVITSSPPESVHAVGRALRHRGVPWVVDLRDAWTFESLRPPFPSALQRRLDERLERRWLRSADAVVCVSGPVAHDLRQRLGIEPQLVPNGWDPDLIEPDEAGGDAAGILDPDRVSLVYTGRFGSYGRDPAPLVRALGELGRTDGETASHLELVVAGPLTAAEAELMRTDVSPARIVVPGSLTREGAIALQRAADALLLLASPRRTQLLNFKLFEYLATGRPILALAAGTEAGRVVQEMGGDAVPADDVAAIVEALHRVVAGELRPPNATAREAYSYPAVAERMAEVAEGAVASARTRRSPYP